MQHEIMDGETIWDLANAFRVGVSEIMAANGLSDAEVTALRPGRVIRIPGVTAVASADASFGAPPVRNDERRHAAGGSVLELERWRASFYVATSIPAGRRRPAERGQRTVAGDVAVAGNQRMVRTRLTDRARGATTSR